MRPDRPPAALGLALAALAAGADAAPVPVPVPVPSPLAEQYYRSGNLLWIVGLGWGLLVPTLILITGLSARLRDAAARAGRRPWAGRLLYVAAFLALIALADAPLAWYAGYLRPRQYGLSDRPPADWALDELKLFGVFAAIAVPVILGLLALIARSPRAWWAWAGALAPPLLLALAFVKPIWIDPLFNRFGPMRDRALEARILALARRAGIRADRVFEVEKRHETRTVNAYVTGLLGTERIVLWDTLCDRLEGDQVLSVMGHEMGHYALNHVVAGLAATTALMFVGLFGVHLAATHLVRTRGGRYGVSRLSDPAALPLLMVLANLANLALLPVGYAYSRHLEHEADRFALELTRDNHAAASAFARFVDTNLGYPRPGPFSTFWRGSHPSLGERIDFANAYRPWERGEPLRYGGYFAREDESGPSAESKEHSFIKVNVGRAPQGQRAGQRANP
jgi:Zn-dependent protease with chaperone function